MRDGTVFRADMYRPDANGKFPVLLKRRPYDKSVAVRRTAYLDPIRAASHGYAVVIQDVRGRYASDGDFSPFFQEIDDGYDLVQFQPAHGPDRRPAKLNDPCHGELQKLSTLPAK